jgi:hypothetical protein
MCLELWYQVENDRRLNQLVNQHFIFIQVE